MAFSDNAYDLLLRYIYKIRARLRARREAAVRALRQTPAQWMQDLRHSKVEWDLHQTHSGATNPTYMTGRSGAWPWTTRVPNPSIDSWWSDGIE